MQRLPCLHHFHQFYFSKDLITVRLADLGLILLSCCYGSAPKVDDVVRTMNASFNPLLRPTSVLPQVSQVQPNPSTFNTPTNASHTIAQLTQRPFFIQTLSCCSNNFRVILIILIWYCTSAETGGSFLKFS